MKQKLVVRKFRCNGAGDDCPSIGFEIVKAKNVEVKPHKFLLRSDVDEFQKNNVKIVVVT
jgi:hypothetical protein